MKNKHFESNKCDTKHCYNYIFIGNVGEHVLGNTASDYHCGISNYSFMVSSRISDLLLFIAN